MPIVSSNRIKVAFTKTFRSGHDEVHVTNVHYSIVVSQ